MEQACINNKIIPVVDSVINRYPPLGGCRDDLIVAAMTMIETYEKGGKIITCGNGGSAADAEHIVGELMKGFLKERHVDEAFAARIKDAAPAFPDASYLMRNLQRPLPAISLVAGVSLPTAFANDQAPDLVFAQQLYGLAQENDVLIAISTSGNSKNVIYAAILARALGIKTIAMTGRDGGKLKELADITIAAPADETYKIQEFHLPIYHALCISVENYFFDI